MPCRHRARGFDTNCERRRAMSELFSVPVLSLCCDRCRVEQRSRVEQRVVAGGRLDVDRPGDRRAEFGGRIIPETVFCRHTNVRYGRRASRKHQRRSQRRWPACRLRACNSRHSRRVGGRPTRRAVLAESLRRSGGLRVSRPDDPQPKHQRQGQPAGPRRTDGSLRSGRR